MKIFIENELIEELYVCNADYIEFKDYVKMLIETNETFQCKLFEFGFENYRYVIKFKITTTLYVRKKLETQLGL
jgi:hypothetical protein